MSSTAPGLPPDPLTTDPAAGPAASTGRHAAWTRPVAQTPAVLVVGAGLAAATAAETLRAEGFTGRIVLVGEEPERPYERPPLSKGLLLGTADRESAFVHATEWYDEHDVELRLGARVVAVDRAARTVTLDDGASLAWTSLLLATGSRPRRLTVPGAELEGVLTLRTLADADRLLAAFAARPRVAIVGGGWIGLETAAAARGAGLDVTVLEQGTLPLLRVLGPEVAQVFADLHREQGVDLRTGVSVADLTTTDGRAVSGVRLADGAVVPAELVLVGVGVEPIDGLAADAGLDVDHGVVVDEHLRTTDPHVLAAGDVALALHPALGRRLRVEHWENARRQGAVAARSILGIDAVDERPPYFYTDQYDLGMEYVGWVDPARSDGPPVVRGDLAGREFLAFWLDGGRVAAGMHVNVWDTADDIEALIRSRRVVEPARLADPAVPLASV